MNYVEHLLILISTLTECVSISAFAFLVGVFIGITSSALVLKICVITVGIKKYQSIINKKKKKHDKIVLLAKSKLNSIEVLISKTLIDSNISHDEFILMKNVLKEYDHRKEEIKSLKFKNLISSSKSLVSIFINNVSYCLKCRKNTQR